ncbi:MAG TPA: hypothetical protein VFN96_01845 [Gemmatimonadales bacterium]|nr:hypothetical protein [Gemmatimonadales bacterium]
MQFAVVTLFQALPAETGRAGQEAVSGLIVGLPIAGAIVLGIMYWRVRRAARARELDPRLYLLPFIAAASASAQVDPEDLEADQERRRELDALRKRGRFLLAAFGASVLLVWLTAAWYVGGGGADRADLGPAYAVVEPEAPKSPELAADTALAIRPPAEPDSVVPDAAEPLRENPPVERRTEPAAGTTRAQTAARSSLRPDPPPRDSPPAPVRSPGTVTRVPVRPTPTDSVRPVVVTPPASPPPAAPPPESVVVRLPATDTASARPAAPPPPPPPRIDPALERSRAESGLRAAAAQAVQEINARRAPAGAAGDAALRRFGDWVRDQRPSASGGGIGEVGLDGPTATASFPVALRWKDAFGVSKQRSIRFRVTVRREGSDWVYAGTELLERFP